MESKKRRLKISKKPFTLDQFIKEQPNGKIGPSKHSDKLNLDLKQNKNAIDEAFYVIDLMAESTANILDHTDQLSELVQIIKSAVSDQVSKNESPDEKTVTSLAKLHKVLFELIASQSYQDVGRQKMELVITNLKKAYQQLEESNRLLEDKVQERTLELAEKNKALQFTVEEAERANKKILDSIRYAQVIQTSILPNKSLRQKFLPKSFTIWRPRDIVGGDLIIVEKLMDGLLVGILDCTGHGVPGALMTMVASSELKQIIQQNVKTNPAGILRQLNGKIKDFLGLDQEKSLSDVGLDAGLCYIETRLNKMTFSGARIPLYFFDNNSQQIQIIKGEKVSIGYNKSSRKVPFKNHEIPFSPSSWFWLATDGITDQTSSKTKISWGTRRFSEVLKTHSSKSPMQQKKLLLESFNTYRGEKEVLDDITVIGFSP